MTTLGRIVCGVRRVALALEKSAKTSRQSLSRSRSTVAQLKFVEGSNGERIIPSPYGESTFPEMTIPQYVWKDLGKYENLVALECGITGRRYTFAEARDSATYVARSLLSMGFREGDVIALVAPNLPETVLSFLGILEAGLVVTTVNPFYTADEISKQLESSGAKAIVTAAEIASTVYAAKSSIPSMTRVPFVVIDDATGGKIPEGSIPYKDLEIRGKSLPPLPDKLKSIEDVAILPYSSGTTGLPKGVMLSHKNLVANMAMVDYSVGMDIWYPTTESYQEVIPVFLPFFHIFGMNGVMLPSLSRGFRMITLPKFLPETFLNVLEKSKATGLFCVPPVVLFLSASPAVKKHHVQHVHAVFSGAAPLAGADVDRMYDKFGLDDSVLKFSQGYGLTESSPVSFIEKSNKKYASIGKNVAGCEARLVDPVTKEDVCTPGRTGELWVRGPHVMKGYLNNDEATRNTLDENGWLKTGDIAYFDENLDFFITDRLKELIKVKGFQVAPAELEALLRTHPDVEEAAVIGIPDARSGEVPKAFVLPKQGKKLAKDDIVNFVKGKVSQYKELQGGVEFVDNIPKNPSGKILRAKLKEEYLR